MKTYKKIQQVVCPDNINLYLYENIKNKIFILSGYMSYSVLVGLKEIFYYRRKNYLMYLLTKKQKKNVKGLYIVLLYYKILNSNYGYSFKIETYGTGYNLMLVENTLFFNVGASYIISILGHMRILYQIQGRKKTILYMYSDNMHVIMNFVQKLLNLRRINIYTGKGIYYNLIKPKLKIGKITKI